MNSSLQAVCIKSNKDWLLKNVVCYNLSRNVTSQEILQQFHTGVRRDFLLEQREKEARTSTYSFLNYQTAFIFMDISINPKYSQHLLTPALTSQKFLIFTPASAEGRFYFQFCTSNKTSEKCFL